MSWIPFVAIIGIFFLTHSLPVRPPVKSRLVQILGPHGFTLVYSILSIGMLSWLIVAAGDAPYVALWDQAPWQRHVVLFGMFAVCQLLAFAIGRPNPFSFGGADNGRFDPRKPGLVRWVRHPLLLALSLWAALHLLPNGDLAHLILFGVFALFALAGMKIVDRRKRRKLGEAEWMSLRRVVATAPLFSMAGTWSGFTARLATGVLVFIVLLILHPVVLGVSPMP